MMENTDTKCFTGLAQSSLVPPFSLCCNDMGLRSRDLHHGNFCTRRRSSPSSYTKTI